MHSYKFGVEWIAQNDEPLEMDRAVVALQISTILLADLAEKPCDEVADDIVKRREQIADGEKGIVRRQEEHSGCQVCGGACYPRHME